MQLDSSPTKRFFDTKAYTGLITQRDGVSPESGAGIDITKHRDDLELSE